MIFPIKHAMEMHSEVKRERELCRATKAHLRVHSSQSMDFPMSSRPSKESTTITTTYLKDSQRQAPRDSQSSINTQKRKSLMIIFFNPCPIDRCHHGLGDYTRQ